MRNTKKASSTGSQVFDFTRSLQRLTPESFFRFIAEYPDKEATSTYLYRLAPVVDRSLAGVSEKNIDMVPGGAITEDMILASHGSGKYHLKFTDGNRGRGQTEVAKTTLEILDPSHPPVFNPTELVVGAPGNDHYVAKLVTEGWQVQEGKLVRPQAADTVLASTVRELAAEVAAGKGRGADDALVGRLLDHLLERRAESGGGSDKEIERALLLAERLTPRQQQSETTDLVKLLVSMVQKQVAVAPPDPVAQLRQAAEFLREIAPAAAPAPVVASGGGVPWSEIIQALPVLLVHGPRFLREFAGMGGAGSAPVVPITGGPMIPAPPVAAAAPPVAAAELAGENAAAPGGQGEAAAPGGQGEAAAPGGQGSEGMNLGQVLGKLPFNPAALRRVVEDAIDAFTRPEDEGGQVSGEDFAHTVMNRRQGEALYDFICSFDNDAILGMLLSQAPPEVQARVSADPAAAVAWLDAFRAYGAEDEGKVA